MSTPAEIIAARIAANANKVNEEVYSDSEDEGGKKAASPVASGLSWGSVANGVKPSSTFKSSTVQEAFSLDADDQLNVARPEFIKILTSVKADTKTNIECTVSQHTKKRTFLITGKLDDVKLAKRLVIKKLTKPVKISFQIPSKLRSRVIGPQGKTLRPIISAYEVNVDIGNEEIVLPGDEDDIFNKVVDITIDGDVEGSKLAKAKILDIIKQETKNLSVKVPIPDVLKPFAAVSLDPLVNQFSDLDISIPDHRSTRTTINIIGDREQAIEAKDSFVSKLAELASTITIEEVPIPKIKQQFLPIDQILEEENVLIKLPGPDETAVKFIGQKSKIGGAKEKARKTTSQYKLEQLDMSKAHRGNLAHVSAVAEYLKSKGFFKKVGSEHNVTVNVPSKKELDGATSIPIEIVINSAEAGEENIKAAKRDIVSNVNKLTPDSTRVIDDIDTFLINKVPSTIDTLAKLNNVSYVILNGRITLFGDEQPSSEDFDFDDSAETNEAFQTIDKALDPLRQLASDLETVVLNVTAANQKFVAGRNNTTLNSILSEVEPNSVEIKLNHNGKQQDSDSLYIHGLKSQVASVQKLVNQVIADTEEFGDKYSTTVSIPATILSRLIGKNGQFMNSLRDEFGVKIDVEDEEASKVEIAIVGIKKNVDACKAKINSVSKKWADETTARLRIENQYHRRLIGSSGKFINRLQDKYGVRIRFPSSIELSSNSPDAPKNKDEVTIRGPSRSVTQAKEELEELYKFEKDNGFEQVLQIPTKAIARVIGKSGETINDISDGTGVEYRFKRNSKEEEETGVVEVTLVGSKAALKEAAGKINEIVDEIENFVSIDVEIDSKYHREIIGQGGSKMREIISKAGGDDLPRFKYHKLLNIPSEGSGSNLVNSQGPKSIVNKIVQQLNDFVSFKEKFVLIEVEVPKKKQRLIVGPSGATRQSLEKEFNVSVEIPRADDNSTYVKLSGLPEDIENAKAKIHELTKDDWNQSIDIPEVYHAFVSDNGQLFKTLKDTYNVEVSHDRSKRASKLASVKVPNPPEGEEESEFSTKELDIVESDNVIPWRLKGDDANTKKALELVQKRLDLAKQSTHGAWIYASKPSLFSKIIGPGGSTVKSIKEKSNTVIIVPKLSDKNNKHAYLIGSPENLEIAKTLISKLD